MKTWVPNYPGLNTRMFVSSVIIDDQMQIHFRRSLKIDRLKESNKLLVPMPGHAIPDDSSVKRHHRRKQSRRAVSFVIVRHCAATPLFQRQSRLGPVQSLNLRFLVNTQHKRFVRGIQVQSNNIIKLLYKLLITTQLKG